MKRTFQPLTEREKTNMDSVKEWATANGRRVLASVVQKVVRN